MKAGATGGARARRRAVATSVARAGDELARRRRGQPVERVPAGEEPLGRRASPHPAPDGARTADARSDQRDALAERAPGPAPATVRAIATHGRACSAASAAEDAVEVGDVDRASRRPFPGDQHRPTGPASGSRPRRRRRPRPGTARRIAAWSGRRPWRDERLAEIGASGVARRDPVASPSDVRLRTNRSSRRRRNDVNRAPDQPSFGNGSSGRPARPLASRSRATLAPVVSTEPGRRSLHPAVVEVVDDRPRAVPGQDDDERLGRRRVLLDVDLAGRDVDEVAGPASIACSRPVGPHV